MFSIFNKQKVLNVIYRSNYMYFEECKIGSGKRLGVFGIVILYVI